MITVTDSIWGAVTNCCEIAPEVYLVHTGPPDDDDEVANGGIMLSRRAAESLLPQKALAFGVAGVQTQEQPAADGSTELTTQGFLHYENSRRILIPLYELLSKRKITNYEVIRKFHEYDVLNAGRLLVPEYFGEFIFPLQLYLRSKKHRRLENGIWVFRAAKGMGLAIHKTVALDALSPSALLYGKPYANSIVFWESFSAVAFYELRGAYQSIRELLPDSVSLMAIIREQFDMYFYLSGKDPDQEYGA